MEECIQLVEGRDGQINNLLRGMESLNGEIENSTNETLRLEEKLTEMELELNEAKSNNTTNNNGGDGGIGGVDPVDAANSALTLAEREELIKLRSEVAEYEVEFRGLKNQDITIRKLESK